jgi:hypothetical protein
MDQDKAEQTSGGPGSLNVTPVVCHSSERQEGPVAAVAEVTIEETVQDPAHLPAQLGPADLESPIEATELLVAGEMAEPTACETAKMELEMAKTPQAETIAEAAETAKAEAPNSAGKLIVLPSRDRDWARDGAASEPQANGSQRKFGKRRIAAVAAVIALATVAGGLGGALATASMMRAGGGASGNHALEPSVARIDADILAIKAGLENNAKLGLTQFSKTSDRLDRIEKAQAEPAAKLARLSEAVEKLRAAPLPLPLPAPIAASATTTAVKDVTGSVTPPPAPPKTEVARLPTVEGWVLRDVANGGALIENRRGIYEVYAGDPVPGLGRIDAIRRQDGRWVVVTSRGLIVAR